MPAGLLAYAFQNSSQTLLAIIQIYFLCHYGCGETKEQKSK
jgi:hypothetical protein